MTKRKFILSRGGFDIVLCPTKKDREHPDESYVQLGTKGFINSKKETPKPVVDIVLNRDIEHPLQDYTFITTEQDTISLGVSLFYTFNCLANSKVSDALRLLPNPYLLMFIDLYNSDKDRRESLGLEEITLDQGLVKYDSVAAICYHGYANTSILEECKPRVDEAKRLLTFYRHLYTCSDFVEKGESFITFIDTASYSAFKLIVEGYEMNWEEAYEHYVGDKFRLGKFAQRYVAKLASGEIYRFWGRW
jgi:hypothetical protein